jgi:calcium channel MID1
MTADVKLSHSYCALSTGPAILNVDNAILSETTRGYGDMLKGQFLLNGLNMSASYRAYLGLPNKNNSEGGIIYSAVYFTAKSDDNCQLVFDMDFCSSVAYAVPGNASAFEIGTLRTFYDDMAKARYQNFTLSLQQISCNASEINRYSLLQSCDDCAFAYQQWLCAVTIPRCADWSNNASYLFPRPVGTSRNPAINEVIKPGNYKEILPCADLCYRIAQDCSAELGFFCPKGDLLSQSYGQYSDDGDVTCSYPGAVYFLASASLLKVHSAFLYILLLCCTVLLA